MSILYHGKLPSAQAAEIVGADHLDLHHSHRGRMTTEKDGVRTKGFSAVLLQSHMVALAKGEIDIIRIAVREVPPEGHEFHVLEIVK